MARSGLRDRRQRLRAGTLLPRRPFGGNNSPVVQHDLQSPEVKASALSSCFVDQSVLETAHLSPAEPVDAEEITDRDTMIIESHSHPPAPGLLTYRPADGVLRGVWPG